MPYKDKNIQRTYEKDNFLNVGIRIKKDDDNCDLINRWQEAASDIGQTLQKYAIIAIKEKLDRDGYI